MLTLIYSDGEIRKRIGAVGRKARTNCLPTAPERRRGRVLQAINEHSSCSD